MRFTIILTPDPEDGGFVDECPAIPGCVSEGASVEEALRNVKEAIEGCLESLLAHNEPVPQEGQVIVATVDADAPAMVTP